MVKSKRALHLQAARNKKTESQREKNNEDELRATEIRENEEWKIQQECAPRAMMMVETKKLQDYIQDSIILYLWFKSHLLVRARSVERRNSYGI